MKILLIEDDYEKAQRISEFVLSEFEGSNVDIARSFNSGLRALIANASRIDIVLLDMSMPSFDVSPEEPTGGSPESFAGEDLLAQMRLRGLHIPTVISTMFDSFGEGSNRMSLSQLTKRLETKFSPFYRGCVYYNAAQSGWQVALKKIMAEIKRGKT